MDESSSQTLPFQITTKERETTTSLYVTIRRFNKLN
jgi:hypothetical protein